MWQTGGSTTILSFCSLASNLFCSLDWWMSGCVLEARAVVMTLRAASSIREYARARSMVVPVGRTDAGEMMTSGWQDMAGASGPWDVGEGCFRGDEGEEVGWGMVGLARLGWADGGEFFGGCTMEGGSSVDDTTAVSRALGTGEEGERGLVSSRCAPPQPTGTLQGWVSWSNLTPRGSLGAPMSLAPSQHLLEWGRRPPLVRRDTALHGHLDLVWRRGCQWSCPRQRQQDQAALPSCHLLEERPSAQASSQTMPQGEWRPNWAPLGWGFLLPSRQYPNWGLPGQGPLPLIQFSCPELSSAAPSWRSPEARAPSPAHLRGRSSTGCRHPQLSPCSMSGLQVLACSHLRRWPPSLTLSLAPDWLVLDRLHDPCLQKRHLPRTSRACYPAPSMTRHPPQASLHGPNVQGWSDVSSRALWLWTWQGRFHSSRGLLDVTVIGHNVEGDPLFVPFPWTLLTTVYGPTMALLQHGCHSVWPESEKAHLQGHTNLPTLSAG